MFKSKKGFTLIELLVVIAIIGILSSVVLASLNAARNKGSDAAVKADLAGARAAAELYYDSASNTYCPTGSTCTLVSACSVTPPAGGVTQDATVQKQIDDAYSKNGGIDGKCGSSATQYVIAMPLRSDTTAAWCIDNSGNSRQINSTQFGALSVTTGCP